MDRPWTKWLVAALAGLFALGLLSWTRPSTEPESRRPQPVSKRPARAPALPTSRPHPSPEPRPVPTRPIPTAQPAPAAAPTPAPLPIEARVAFNRSAWDALVAIQQDCLADWARESGTVAEMVVHARVVDGQLDQVHLRDLGELPQEVVSCAYDAAWSVDWYVDDALQGEVQLQRRVTAYPDQELQ